MNNSIQADLCKVKDFIVENFLFGDNSSLTDNVSFIESGIVDSTGILELVSFLEQTFDIKIADNELVPENLDSLNNIATFLAGKTPCAE